MMTAVWCLLGLSSEKWQVSTEGGRLFITSVTDTQTNKNDKHFCFIFDEKQPHN